MNNTGPNPEKKSCIALCAAGEIYGGVEEWVYTFVRQAQERDLFPAIFVILFYDGPLAVKLRGVGCEVVIPDCGKYDFGAVSKVQKILKEKRIDLVHTHGYRATITCAAAAKRLHLPVVKTEHSIIESPKNILKLFSYLKMHLNLALDIYRLLFYIVLEIADVDAQHDHLLFVQEIFTHIEYD